MNSGARQFVPLIPLAQHQGNSFLERNRTSRMGARTRECEFLVFIDIRRRGMLRLPSQAALIQDPNEAQSSALD
jgi:hypothetical protein